jgi:hypothetical protein
VITLTPITHIISGDIALQCTCGKAENHWRIMSILPAYTLRILGNLLAFSSLQNRKFVPYLRVMGLNLERLRAVTWI